MKIQKEEMVGGTFTLSNIGAIGGTYARLEKKKKKEKKKKN